MIRITFFPDGKTMAFENGEQVPVAQKPWLTLFAEYLDKQGVDPTQVRFFLPDGNCYRIFQTDEGFNFEKGATV